MKLSINFGGGRGGKSGSTSFALLLVAGMLVFGSVNTISKKLGYNTCSTGLDGVYATKDAAGPWDADDDQRCPAGERKFQKPWTQTLVMFTGEATLMIYFLGFTRKAVNEERMRGSMSGAPESRRPLRFSDSLVCILPAMCDLGGTTLSGIGLLFTTASTFQMLRGSIIAFTGLFTVVFLKRKIKDYQWLGIVVVIAGVSLVGGASYIGSSSSSTSSAGLVMTGNVLVVVSQIMSAFQMVVEEKFLKARKLPAEFVVGCEGIIGALAMACVVLPLVYHIPFKHCDDDWCLDGDGIHEDALDAATLFKNSALLAVLVAGYWISIAFYNFCGLAVAKTLSAVHRTLVDACRTIIVFSVDIMLYSATNGRYGEKWDSLASPLQILGFGVMVLGTFIHNGILRIEGFEDRGIFIYDDSAAPTPAVKDDENLKGFLTDAEEEEDTTGANAVNGSFTDAAHTQRSSFC